MFTAESARPDQPFVAPINLTKHVEQDLPPHLEPQGDGVVEWTLPQGKSQTILVDLEAQDIDPSKYDEIRFDIKPAVGHPFMNWSLHGHLDNPGQISSWYLKFQTPLNEWTTGRFSLHLDDDGVYVSRDKNPRAPMDRWLKIQFSPQTLGYPGEPQDRKLLLRNVRLVRHRVSADFELAETEFIDDDAEIAYVYPLHLANRTDQPVELQCELDTDGRLHYFSAEGPKRIQLAANESRTVPIKLSMPRHEAQARAPLYSEPLFIRLWQPGVEDSDVVPLLGYRRWPMWGTVPVFNARAWTPVEFQAWLDARTKAMPGIAAWRESVVKDAEGALRHDWPVPDFGPPEHNLSYRCKDCKNWLRPETPTSLHRHVCPTCDKVFDDEHMMRAYLLNYNHARAKNIKNLALAWLMTGEAKYAEKAREILLDYAEGWLKMPNRGTRSTAGKARLGWSTLHASYTIPDFSRGFHYLQAADCMDEQSLAAARRFIRDIGLNVITHSVIYGNQQSEHLRAYGEAGLATGFWPMAAEAIHGEFGYHEVVEYGFTSDGIAEEGGAYHRASFGALNHLAEFAWERGMNLYTPRFKRVFDRSILAGLAGTSYELAYRVYRDPTYIPQLRDRSKSIGSTTAALYGVAGVPDAARMVVRSDHMPGAGYIFLRQGTAADNREIRLNYIKQFDRSEHDRLTTFFFRNGRQIDDEVGRMGYAVPGAGWMYATAAQNCIVVDGQTADATRGQLIAFEPSPDTPVAVVANDVDRPLYQGVTQVRGIALLGEMYVVFDAVSSDEPHTFDRYQYGKGGPKLQFDAKPVGDAIPHKPELGRFTDIVGGDTGRDLRIDFSQGLKMRLVSDGAMQAYKAVTFGHYQGQAMNVTFVRRPDTTNAAFLAAFSLGDTDPAELKILDGSTETPAFQVATGGKTYVVRINVPLGEAAVETK